MFLPASVPVNGQPSLSRRPGRPSAIITAIFLFGLLAEMAWGGDLPPRPFLHPDRIRYDRQCLTIDGRDVFIYSGAFHYFRCPKELWRDRFQKIKAAGFNCVETYVAWNVSEPEMPSGLDDFSKVNLTDLDDFLSLAEESGLYVIVRPGPYICAEWDTGGYPQWLLTKQPSGKRDNGRWLRSDDPVYLAWCKHWYDAVCPVIAKHQLTRRAPGQAGVILVQLENEYDYAHFPDDVKLNQLSVLGQTARADGIDVPLITCWTHQIRGQTNALFRQVFDCCNFYPRWDVDGIQKDITKLRQEQPDAPLATTELQGGWFSEVGGKLSEDQEGINAAQINNLTLFAIQNGETILNYYMLFGGTNPGDRAARNLTTTYDYNAPIREWGGVGERYQRVWALGHLLQEHGAELARSTVVNCAVTVPQNDVTVVMRQDPEGGRYLFIRTSQHAAPRAGTARVKVLANNARPESEIVFDYQLEPFGSKILYLPPHVQDVAQGEWLPKPPPAIERPSDLPTAVNLTSAVFRNDEGPSHWWPGESGKDLAATGIYDSGFIYYRATIATDIPTNLLVQFPDGDDVLAGVNGHAISPAAKTRTSSVFSLPSGRDEVRLLYENHGHANGGSAMAEGYGITAARLTSPPSGSAKSLDDWRLQLVNHLEKHPEKRPETKVDFNDAGWAVVSAAKADANQLTTGQSAVFRTSLDLTAAQSAGIRQILTFARIDDFGWVYVNGRLAGKTTDWSQAYSFDITRFLHRGHNVIAVVVQNDAGGGGLGQPALNEELDGPSVPLKAFGRPSGDEQQWWNPRLAEGDWKAMAIGNAASSSSTGSLLTWYRLNFALPAAQPDVWVPWRLHLTGGGNGFIYLNGHAIGRYWAAGPQHDFFLPECWLQFGAGRTNNLTLNLRPVKNDALIQSATVEPYFDYAEKR
jgi:hypothetical protein